jgi:decaprenylphospho-beta-D-erythro-pentofuranosid-2-ulose 2-reductase
MPNVFILGATSAIAQHVARQFARGSCFVLAGRNGEHLKAVADDLRVRGATNVEVSIADLASTGRHAAMVDEAAQKLGSVDIALIAYGTLPNQAECEASYECANEAIQNNFVSVVSWLTHLAPIFEKQKQGTIAVITSVAGDRGRKSNYLYGASKGGLGIFLQGLRNRLHASSVHVLTIKPGFVDTPMTAHLKKGLLFAKPETVARKIHCAILKKKDVVYVPGLWKPIMWIIRAIPECLFKRMSL